MNRRNFAQCKGSNNIELYKKILLISIANLSCHHFISLVRIADCVRLRRGGLEVTSGLIYIRASFFIQSSSKHSAQLREQSALQAGGAFVLGAQ